MVTFSETIKNAIIDKPNMCNLYSLENVYIPFL